MVVKPFHFCPGTVFAEHGFIIFFLLLMVQTQGSLEIKAPAGNQVAG
jgi:hypothetical protein